MKAVILAGGLGTRLSEKTIVRPKPMVEIGGKPILWHVMKIYSAHGINDYMVKQFIADFWRQWRLQDRLPVVPTYHEAKQGGHTSGSEAAE
jgi:NDP-sugar pyrophosphorylase family protein